MEAGEAADSWTSPASAETAAHIFASAVRALQEQSGLKTTHLQAAHAAAIEEAVSAARCQAIEEAAVRFAQERNAEVAEAVAVAVASATLKYEQQRLEEKSGTEAQIRQLREQHEATVHVSAARISEIEERVRAEEQEAARKALAEAVTEATVRIQEEHRKAMADAQLELSMQHGKEKDQAVEEAVARTRDEMTQTLSDKYESRLNRLLVGIAESDAAHEARRAALQLQLCQANEALKLTLDRLTAHKQPKR